MAQLVDGGAQRLNGAGAMEQRPMRVGGRNTREADTRQGDEQKYTYSLLKSRARQFFHERNYARDGTGRENFSDRVGGYGGQKSIQPKHVDNTA